MLQQLPAWSSTTPTYDVLAVRYGTVDLTKSRQYLNYHLYDEPDAPVTLDYYFWVVRNDELTVVVDTGFHAEVARRRGRQVLVDPVDAFARVGLDASSAPDVVVTHAHWDHIGNLDRFPRSRMVVGAEEIEFLRGPYRSRHQYAEHLERRETDLLLSAVDEGRGLLVEGSLRLAEGIEVVEVGGHTPGELIVLVNGGTGPVLLASDAVHFTEEYEQDRAYAVLSDLQGMYRTYDHVRWILEGTGADLVAGHDPDVASRFPAADGDLADLVTVVSQRHV